MRRCQCSERLREGRGILSDRVLVGTPGLGDALQYLAEGRAAQPAKDTKPMERAGSDLVAEPDWPRALETLCSGVDGTQNDPTRRPNLVDPGNRPTGRPTFDKERTLE